MKGNFKIIHALGFASALALHGCASLINPYVRPVSGFSTTAPTVEAALKKGENWREAYYKAASEHSAFKNVVSGLVLPLTAVGAYQAITGNGTSDQITRYGVAATALFTLAQQFTSKPRQGVYFAGMGALTCVALAGAPLIMDGTQKADFDLALKTQRSTVSQLSKSIVEAEISGASAGELAQAKNVLNEAKSLLSKATELQALLAQGGNIVSARIDQVIEKVADELRKTEPEPSNILALVQQFRPLATNVIGSLNNSGGVAAQAVARGLGSRSPGLSAARSNNTLASDAGAAAGASEVLRPMVARFDAISAQVASLSACSSGVSAEPIWSIQPDVTEINLKVNEVYVLFVRASTGFPGINLQSAGETVTMNSSLNPGLATVTLTAKAVTVAPAILIVTGPDGAARSIVIKVSAVQETPLAAVARNIMLLPTSTSAGLLGLAEQDALRAGVLEPSGLPGKVQALQLKLGIPAPAVAAGGGAVGPKTRYALAQCNQKIGQGGSNDINEKLINAAFSGQCR